MQEFVVNPQTNVIQAKDFESFDEYKRKRDESKRFNLLINDVDNLKTSIETLKEIDIEEIKQDICELKSLIRELVSLKCAH